MEELPVVAIQIGTKLRDAERQLILATYRHQLGDKRRTAAILDISLKTLYNKLNEYNDITDTV